MQALKCINFLILKVFSNVINFYLYNSFSLICNDCTNYLFIDLCLTSDVNIVIFVIYF